MIRRRTITSYVWNSVSGNKMVILSNCIRNFFRKFELLGNSTQGENPAPDNPQEIKSAGRKSKNLFNIADLRVGQVQKDGTINEKQIYYRTVILDVPQDGKYRITFNSNDDYTMLYLTEAYANGAYSNPYIRVHAGNSNSLISLKKGKNILSFSTYNNNTQVDFPKDHNIMIAAESETLDYEPYGYLLDVKVTGENLLDMADIQNENGKIESNYGIAKSIKPFNIIKDRKYLLISKGTMIADVKYSSIYFGKDDLAYGQDSSRKLTTGVGYSCFIGTETRKILVAKETCTITKTMMHGTRTEKDAYEVEELGLFEIINDNPNTPYEPYTEQTVQIALDEPLRGIGEYKDVLTKDGVVRKIKRIVFDGSEDEKWGIGIERENVIDFVSTQFSDATKINEHQRSMMDKLKWSSGVWGRDEIGQDMFARILRINMPKTLTPDLQTFKTWLSQNPLTVDYVLETPITEPLPESVQQQLQALHSENGTTHVFVDSGEVECGINIEYKYKS
jgi:hypothetical protein